MILIPAKLPPNTDASALNIYLAQTYGWAVTQTPTNATNSLLAMLALAQTMGGGRCIINNVGGLMSVNATIPLQTAQWSNVDLSATAPAFKIVQTVPLDLFYVMQAGSGSGGGGNKGGVHLHDLFLGHTNGLTGTAAAIHLQQCRNVWADHIVTEDSPVGIFFDNVLQCGIQDAEIVSGTTSTVNGLIGVWIGSSVPGHGNRSNQVQVFRTTVGFSGSGINCIGYKNEQSVHASVLDSYFFGGDIGYALVPTTATQNDILQSRGVCVQIGARVYGEFYQPQAVGGGGSRLMDYSMVSGQNQAGNVAVSTSVGVYVDVNGSTDPYANINGRWVDRVVEGWGLYGYQFNGGQNFQIIGGHCGSCGTAGIAVTGPIANLRVLNLDLSAQYENLGPPQLHALLINIPPTATLPAGANNAPMSVTLEGCPMYGYPVGTVVDFVGAPASFQLRLRHCPGYTDQQHVVAATMPAIPTTAASLGYYGTSRARLSALTSYTVNGKTWPVGTGTVEVWLDPYDTFNVTGTGGTSDWIGEDH